MPSFASFSDLKVKQLLHALGDIEAVKIGVDSTAGTATLRAWDIPAGSLRKEDSKPKVFLIQGGDKRWVTSPQVLFALGKSWADVRVVPDGGLSSLPDGPDVNLIQVGVTPHPVPINTVVTLTVNVSDLSTGSSVAGQVKIDGQVVANTNTPFSYTFRPKRRRVSVRPPEWEVTYPQGVVVVTGYPDAPIDFGFPDI
jgi:hypothetical protein